MTPTWPAYPGVRAVGLDWSGSKKAGKKIWQAHLETDATSQIVLSRLDRPFLDRPEPANVRAAFAGWFAGLHAQVVGMDFCFGLRRDHARQICVAAGELQTSSIHPVRLGSHVARLFPEPEGLRTVCAREGRRVTDGVARSPFAPTNLRMFRQTWLGLTCLKTLEGAAIAPWESSGSTIIVEVLHALIVRELGSTGGYKGRRSAALAGREQLTRSIEKLTKLRPADARQLIDDAEGDAIDAVLAGLAALRAHHQGFAGPLEPVFDEGWIY